MPEEVGHTQTEKPRKSKSPSNRTSTKPENRKSENGESSKSWKSGENTKSQHREISQSSMPEEIGKSKNLKSHKITRSHEIRKPKNLTNHNIWRNHAFGKPVIFSNRKPGNPQFTSVLETRRHKSPTAEFRPQPTNTQTVKATNAIISNRRTIKHSLFEDRMTDEADEEVLGRMNLSHAQESNIQASSTKTQSRIRSFTVV